MSSGGRGPCRLDRTNRRPRGKASDHLRGIALSVALLPVLLSASGTEPANTQRPDAGVEPAARPALLDSYGKLPLRFERNTGQTDGRVEFLSRGPGYTLFLTGTEAVLNLHPGGSGSESAILRMQLARANTKPNVVGLEELPGKANYFIGNDRKKWRTNVRTYAKVKYERVYPGIDLVYYGNQRQLEYDFVLAPGADPEAITLDLVHSAGRDVTIDAAGDVLIGAADAEVRFDRPIIYQTDPGGEKHFVDGRFVRKGRGRVGFEVDAYDHTRPLIIDPTLIYSTFLGGSGQDEGVAIAVDAAGNGYVTGTTRSLNFPTVGAVQGARNGSDSDVFVAKLNDTGSALVFSTYLGGTTFSGHVEKGNGIAIDAINNVYVTGATHSTDFPTTPGAVQPTYGGGPQDAFVTKLDASGTFLVYSTYLGGSNQDFGRGIAVDAFGDAYVTGLTSVPCCGPTFPTTAGAFQTVHPATTGTRIDAFVTKLNVAGGLVYSTFLGGKSWDEAFGIAVDSAGSAYVTGFTNSSNFPTTPDAFQPAISVDPGSSFPATNHRDVFVTKLDVTGSLLVYSTFLGGSNQDEGQGIAVDDDGNAYVTGLTASSNLPTTAGAFRTTAPGGGFDAFVTKIHSGGSSLDYSTYLGGSTEWDLGRAIAVDSAGSAWVTGLTRAPGFPTTADAFQRFFTTGGGWGHAFVTKLNAAGSGLSYSSFLGTGCSAGCAETEGLGIAVDGAGAAYVTGDTKQGFPTTAEAFQRSSAGGGEAFVSKFFVAGSENQAPAVAPDAAAVNVDEGSAANMTGTYSDPDAGNDVAITASAGTVTKTGTGTGTWSWSFAAQDGPLPSQAITITADDGQGGVATTTFDLTVNNVPPAPAIGGAPVSAPEGASIGMSASATDASPVDEAAGFGFSWSVTRNGTPLASGSGATFSFTPDDDGAYLVTVAATDKDGGTGTGAASVTVSNAAPVIGSVTGPSGPLALGAAASLTAAFGDAGTGDTHTCSVRWDALSTSTGTVTETSGSGTCAASHTYALAGVYTVSVTVTDDEGGAATQAFEYVVVYDPAAGFVTGHGKFESPAGAYALDPALEGTARFGFVSKYKKGASVPTGNTEFHFATADFHFSSESYQWLVVAGPLAQFKGDGTVNGDPGYGFLLTATDGAAPGGGGVDKVRIKIWNTSTGAIVYDNRHGASDDITGADATPITHGNIVIHAK